MIIQKSFYSADSQLNYYSTQLLFFFILKQFLNKTSAFILFKEQYLFETDFCDIIYFIFLICSVSVSTKILSCK